jgi:hypothetical protein
MYVRSKLNDIGMGLSNEAKVYSKLKRILCPKYGEKDIVKTADKYAKWDWTGDINGTHFEMKSRRNMKMTYPTTLLPVHKVMKIDEKQVFIFHFTDKTCYIEYDEEVFKGFKQRMGVTMRDGVYDPPQLQYEIPVSLLADLEDVAL